MTKWIHRSPYFLLLLAASPTHASSYTVLDGFMILGWLVLSNIYAVCIAIIAIFCTYYIYRISKGKGGFYLYVNDDSIWVGNIYIEKAKMDEIAKTYGIDDYLLLLDGELVEYKNSILAAPGASYEMISSIE